MNFKNKEASALLEFNADGHLLKYELSPGTFDNKAYKVFFANFPININWIATWKKQGFSHVEIVELKQDLSFETFYNRYNHKVSKRSKAENVWNRMSDTEKAKALAYINKYDKYLSESKVNKKYPETYLNSEMWNN
jgi:hypothetical protein